MNEISNMDLLTISIRLFILHRDLEDPHRISLLALVNATTYCIGQILTKEHPS